MGHVFLDTKYINCPNNIEISIGISMYVWIALKNRFQI